jgi:hypothetical protein
VKFWIILQLFQYLSSYVIFLSDYSSIYKKYHSIFTFLYWRYTRCRWFPTFMFQIFFTFCTCINVKILFLIYRIFYALILLSPLFKVHLCYEALPVCIEIKHAEDFTSALVYSSLLKLTTNIWIVKATTKISYFNFLQRDCKETHAQFCEFVVIFLWLIIVTDPSSLLRISRSNESTKVSCCRFYIQKISRT